MGHHKSDKSYRTAECRDNGCKQSGDHKQHIARGAKVDAKVFSITPAQQQSVERLYQQQRGGKPHNHNSGKNRQLAERDSGEIAKSPYHKRMHTLFCGKEIKQRDCRRGDITYQDTNNQQHRAALHNVRHHEQQSHHNHRSHKCAGKRGYISASGDTKYSGKRAAERKHSASGTQTCPRGDAKNRGVGERVAKQGLQQQSRHGERTSGKRSRDDKRQPTFEYYKIPRLIV